MHTVIQPSPPSSLSLSLSFSLCFKHIRHEVIFSQKQLNRNSLHVALRSWAERGEMITEQQPQTLCVSSEQSAGCVCVCMCVCVCERFSLCFSNIQVIASLCLLDRFTRPNRGRVFTVEMELFTSWLCCCFVSVTYDKSNKYTSYKWRCVTAGNKLLYFLNRRVIV